MYKRRIAELESQYNDIDRKIKQKETPELLEKWHQLRAELAQLRRRQFEHDHEYVDMSDDDR